LFSCLAWDNAVSHCVTFPKAGEGNFGSFWGDDWAAADNVVNKAIKAQQRFFRVLIG
jgi:hypothetical protein